jgi:hypothetical protein
LLLTKIKNFGVKSLSGLLTDLVKGTERMENESLKKVEDLEKKNLSLPPN